MDITLRGIRKGPRQAFPTIVQANVRNDDSIGIHAAALHVRLVLMKGSLSQVDGNKVRLYGVDAPEARQSCRAADGSQFLCGAAC